MKVKAEGRRRMTMNVITGLRNIVKRFSTQFVHTKTYEYHSQAEYSAVISKDNVRNPEWVVLEAEMREKRSE
jgi:hypothetical protein